MIHNYTRVLVRETCMLLLSRAVFFIHGPPPCIEHPRQEVVELLLETFPEGAATASKDGRLALHVALQFGTPPGVVQALLARPSRRP